MNKILAPIAVVATALAPWLAMESRAVVRFDAGGPELRMVIAGNGNQTVVFEAGAGGPLESWIKIQPEVGKFARTVSYDRAGNGLSKRGPVPRDGRHIAAELHAALHNAHAAPPYILVGHSLGGPYIRVFAGMYPNEIAGMVLVDPTQEELITWSKAHRPKPTTERPYRPEDEVDCAPATFAQAAEHPLPANIPISLIAGQGPRVIPGFLTHQLKEEVLKDKATLYPMKLKFYQEWVAKIPGARLIVTENSGHGIPYEEPELVVKTIREVVQSAGAKK